MKTAKTKWSAVLIESVNCIIIQYALSNTAMLMQANPLFILLFAAKLWTWSRYWRSMKGQCESRILPTLFLAGCFAVNLALLYFVGRAVGEIVPF